VRRTHQLKFRLDNSETRYQEQECLSIEVGGLVPEFIVFLRCIVCVNQNPGDLFIHWSTEFFLCDYKVIYFMSDKVVVSIPLSWWLQNTKCSATRISLTYGSPGKKFKGKSWS